jgi:predicted transcriptional regulator
MKKLQLFVLCIVLMNCKVQKYALNPTEKNISKTTYHFEGKELIVSKLTDSKLRIHGDIVNNNFTLSLEIVNLSENRIEFDPMNIIVSGIDKFDYKGNMKIVEPEKYLRNIKRAENANVNAAAVYGLMAALSYNTTESLYYQLVASNNTSNVTNRKLKIASELLKKHTIFGKEKTAGFVLVEVDSGTEKYYGFNGINGLKNVKLEIPVGKEVHTLNFVVKRSV